VITIILIAFLVLLVVSMAALTRVETQVAINFQKMSLARDNALFSLNMALGQLQKYAGPDQRITATAQLGDPSNVNGIPAPADGRRHWLGVWGNGNAPSSSTGSPVLLNWLVSGNENATFSATNGAPPFSGVSGVSFTPSAAVTSLGVGSGALSDLGTAAQPFRLLLGSKSAGTDVSRYVAAPLRSISTSASSLPGFSATDTSTKTIGRYAWWIGDEGVKARANLLDPHSNKTGPNVAERGYSYVIAQRTAWELMDRAGTPPSILGGVLEPFDARLSSVISPANLGMVSTDWSIASSAVKERVHDLTTYSFGVLADVSVGGLKKDLTRALTNGAPSANELARGAANAPPATSDYIFPPNLSDTYTVPNWGLLRSFANTQVSAGGAVIPRPPTATQVGIGPVLTYFGVGFDVTSPAFPPASAVTPQPIRLCLFPVAVLWNPYTVTLKGADYMVGIRQRSAILQVQITNTAGVKATLYLNKASFDVTSLANRYFDFKLSCPDIPPGQSIVFTLAAGTVANTAYVPGQTTLVPGLNPTLSVVMDTGAIVATASEAVQSYSITSINPGSEADIVITEYVGGTRPTGDLPPSSSPYWYQTVQRSGSLGNNLSGMNNINLSSSSSTPRFALRMQAGFSAAGSSLSNPSTAVELPWIAHASFRSPVIGRSKLDSWVSTVNGNVTGLQAAYAHRFDAITAWPTFNTLNSRASAGLTLNNNGTPVDVSLWEFPSPQIGLLSIGQLQHANLSLFGLYPSYPIGNSLADFHLPRNQSFSSAGQPPISSASVTLLMGTYYDLSWHLNYALWDRYFFSTVPVSWVQSDVDVRTPLPNARFRFYSKALSGSPDVDQLRANPASATSDPYNQASANLLVMGGFNVNSASEQAWRAVLGGVNQLAYNPQTRDAGSSLQAALARFSNPIANQNLSDPWNGYRQLSEAQIKQLAANIVVEVRKRGPFLSLAEFINRRLVNDATGLKGALQAAIDATTTGSGAVNDRSTVPFNLNRASNIPSDGPLWVLDHLRNDTSNSDSAHRSRSAFAPKFLTQADILSTLGPSLAARSDTFVVRAYGETVNPLLSATDSSYITGRAWCEAVVQRLPDYVDMDDPALVSLESATAPANTNQENRTFGRQFKIISFRWLTPADI
jgi:hypothetical protein